MSDNEAIEFEGMPDAQARKMFPDRPTEEVVAEIVAQNPRAHGVTVEERKRRALAQAKAEAAADAEFFADDDSTGNAGVAPVLERAPVVENTSVGDLGGEKRNTTSPSSPSPDALGTDGREPGIPSTPTGSPAPGRAAQGTGTAGPCDHTFPEDPDAASVCAKCGTTFEQWVNS